MIAAALREAVAEGQFRASLPANIVSGLTVGIVALPLSMGLAIASGVPPQHGLYTAIVGGFLIAALGGSRFNISGPTAAFVVVLLPVVQAHGLGGLLLSGAMAGLITMAFGLMRLGRLIQLIPYPVVVGFTAGIGTVIATLQLKDFLGLSPAVSDAHFLSKLAALWQALPGFRWEELTVGALTLLALILWRRTRSRIPAYLIALLLGTLLGQGFTLLGDGHSIDTIASRFSYWKDGEWLAGIPAVAPVLSWPWDWPGADGQALQLSPSLIQQLIGPAFAIALLGALESLLCAVVADGMTGSRHNPDGELIAQGLGNVAVAFAGGIPATAAIARTATNVRSGGSNPIAAMTHSLFVLVAMLLGAAWLSMIPMAAMAAVLMMVAWNMSEAEHALRIIRRAPRSDVLVFFSCYSLTVLIDMQVAVAVGVALASALFIRRMVELTHTELLQSHSAPHSAADNDPGLLVYSLSGPLFFGVAHKALKVISSVRREVDTVVLDLQDVNLLDTTAMMNLESIARDLEHRHTRLVLVRVRPRLQEKMQRYGLLSAGIRVLPDLADVMEERASRAEAGEA